MREPSPTSRRRRRCWRCGWERPSQAHRRPAAAPAALPATADSSTRDARVRPVIEAMTEQPRAQGPDGAPQRHASERADHHRQIVDDACPGVGVEPALGGVPCRQREHEHRHGPAGGGSRSSAALRRQRIAGASHAQPRGAELKHIAGGRLARSAGVRARARTCAPLIVSPTCSRRCRRSSSSVACRAATYGSSRTTSHSIARPIVTGHRQTGTS